MRRALKAASRFAGVPTSVAVASAFFFLGFGASWTLLPVLGQDDVPAAAAVEEEPSAEPPGLGDPGQLQEVRLITGRFEDGALTLSGRDASQQLLVTGVFDSGQTRDITRDVSYHVTPPGIVEVDPTGYAIPLNEGEAQLLVVSEAGPDAVARIRVTNLEVDLPVNFPNQVVPIFTKFGCNGGGCHGKSGGQNGFRLSLLGFEPTEDYEFLVKEARGRRLFPAAPARSLLLQKATAELPHGGGQRLDVDSPAYRILYRWIEQGMPYGNPDDPTVTHIEVLPPESLMERDGSQQLLVAAHYSNGDIVDVTRMTQFESNDPEMAEVTETGLVTSSRLTGSVAVMARYQGSVGVFRATVPLGVAVEGLPEPRNFIDEHVFAKLVALGLPPSGQCDDATFLRRVTVDLVGRLPTRGETDAFLANDDPLKREQLVDQLLDSPEYAEYFANKWNAVLRNRRRRAEDKRITFAFHDWIVQALDENMPYDRFVRSIVAATGTVETNPAVAWYREVRDASAQVEDTAQLFLGMRIQCARCHHHPFERWSQEDYYGFQAFFSRVGRKRSPYPNEDRIFHQPGTPSARNPKTGNNVPPTGLGAEPVALSSYDDPRHALVDWMAQPDNPFFARALVNRYWKHFFGRGLVDPEDDMRVTNPATHPELLDALAADFVDSGFDLKHLIRTICLSETYQRSAEPNEWNADDKQNFSRFYPRRLTAEVLLDAIDQVTSTNTNFREVPAGTRAVGLPDNGFNSYFLTVFGRPESASACECERTAEANLAQSLHLLNSNEIHAKLTTGGSLPDQLARAEGDHREHVTGLYRLAFSRDPTPEELQIAMEYVTRHEDTKAAYEDLVWVIINTKEFMFNH